MARSVLVIFAYIVSVVLSSTPFYFMALDSLAYAVAFGLASPGFLIACLVFRVFQIKPGLAYLFAGGVIGASAAVFFFWLLVNDSEYTHMTARVGDYMIASIFGLVSGLIGGFIFWTIVNWRSVSNLLR